MRFVRPILVLVAVLGCLTLQAQPKFKFENRTQKFEKVKADTTISFDFFYSNTGDQPLIISEIKVACDCTKPTFSKEPVMPGKRAKIHVTFDTRGKIGWQDRTLIIYSNVPGNKPPTVRFMGKVDHKATVKGK